MGARAIKKKLDKAQEALDIPVDLLASFTVEMVSDREAVLSGRVTVLDCGMEHISLKLGDRELHFSGTELVISCLAPDGAKISGCIEKLEFKRAV